MAENKLLTSQSESADNRYRGVTAPKIPRVSETESTVVRRGSQVLVGRGGGHLKRDFVPSHKAKEAKARVI